MHLPFFRLGRRNQVEKLYRELAPSLVAYARSFGMGHAAAEDAVQRTFLALLNRKEEVQEPRPFLFRAVRNALLNHVRDHLREIALMDGGPWFQTDPRDAAAELDVRRAVAALPTEQREVVMMHIWGGLTFAEVAEALQVPVNTAASRYRYAIATLKKTLVPVALKDGL